MPHGTDRPSNLTLSPSPTQSHQKTLTEDSRTLYFRKLGASKEKD